MSQSSDPWENPPVSDRLKAGLILLLAGVAGYVDAVGFLNLAHLFTSHMSGNSAAAGAYLGHGEWQHALRRGYTIPIFVLGVFAGALLTEVAIARRVRSVFTAGLALETVLLVVYLITGHYGRPAASAWGFWLVPALPAFAMGVQNATLHRVGHSYVRTTYVTGMLTEFAEGIAAYLFWRYERARSVFIGDHSTGPSRGALGRALLRGGIWLVFMVGASLGSFVESFWQFRSLFFPILGLLLVVAFDLRRPLYTRPS